MVNQLIKFKDKDWYPSFLDDNKLKSKVEQKRLVMQTNQNKKSD
jgi:hypothetical protein